MSEDHLWQPPDRGQLNSIRETRRVLELYLAARYIAIGEVHPADHKKCDLCTKWRREFAREWVGVAHAAGLHEPGQDARTPLREGETEAYRREDAAQTRIRQFEAGQPQNEWVLCGIETTLAHRAGMAYPPCAYRTQGKLL